LFDIAPIRLFFRQYIFGPARRLIQFTTPEFK
jgi:hypothetical protein